MIDRTEMLPLLVEACPSFSEGWNEHKKEYFDEESYLPYIALGAFARHLVEKLRKGETSEFEAIFDAIERLITVGDGYVRDAILIGLFESLQNVSVREGERNGLRRNLRPTSAKWWEQVELFWHGQIKYVGETIGKS
jgi:hypothetical protein